MSGLLGHLNFLVGSSADGGDGDRRLLDEWLRYGKIVQGTKKEGGTEEELEPEEPWDSVLARVSASPDSQEVHPLVSQLLSKPNVEHLLSSLYSTLSSTRPSEAISEELAEMIGFEDIELVMEILSDRPAVIQGLSDWLTRKEAEAPSQSTSGKGKQGHTQNALSDTASLSPEAARQRMEENFRTNASRPLFIGVAREEPEALPHVYTSSSITQNNVLSQFGTKYLLPINTTRAMYEDYEEVVIPPTKPVPPRQTERLVPVSELDELARPSFSNYDTLNRIQSIVYPTAYGSNENMLVCAPTGAGKTDVAMLTILRALSQYRKQNFSGPVAASIDRNAFKIIYVAPMKALAAEIVRKLGKRLKWLSIVVKELTGDMQLTKSEIAETQMIVTTPEKWDVVTRKPTGEGEVASKVKLLIIDEVHLLNDERGAVIETIVARTLRQVESSQSVIRIVGLSATLPNFIDVADFLSVSRQTGLFYFDSSFRPIPLEQHFIGIRGKPGSERSKKNLDRVTYEKVKDLVAQGHQVMVFVHSRKDTVKSAQALREAALADGVLEDFSCQDHPQWSFFRRETQMSRNREMKELFDDGFGIHHAGMLRSDRNLAERMFDTRAIKVLCCTATLAWGINLPAHAVIIKGTQLYDSSKGAFVDLSVLDVLQVFGRAGRPGLETSGEGYLCTTEDKLAHYLEAITSQHPIESKFTNGMIDSLNAEISLGTVTNVRDGVQWLGYTYLFVRMLKNPFQYGLTREEPAEDPQLDGRRSQLITLAARKLAEARMISFDQNDETFTITDIGRIAARFYIRHSSIEIFNKEFKPKMTEADVLAMLSMSTEFDQIKIRESEQEELKQMAQLVPCTVKGGADTNPGKVNILLQGYISGYRSDDFGLVSDTGYIAQNAGRIVRALLEIAISQKWANVSTALMGMTKAIEKRMWPFDYPLKQFPLKADALYGLERWANDYEVAELASMTAKEIGDLIHLNPIHGKAVLDAAKQFPKVDITYHLRPLGADVLKISVHVARAFNWSSKLHGSAEPFWLWVEDHEGSTILQLSHLLFRQITEGLDVDYVISVPNGRVPPSVTIRFVSDRWIGAEDELYVSLDSLVMPTPSDTRTPRLDLPFLTLSVLQNPVLEGVYACRLHGFNAIQTQIFWSLMHTPYHALLCAPTGSGKSVMGHLLVWMTLSKGSGDHWVLVVVPRRPLAVEIVSELQLASAFMGTSIEMATGQNLLSPVKSRTVRVALASEVFEALSDKRDHPLLKKLALVVCENLEQLDATYELAVSLLRYATQHHPTRFAGMSSSLNDPTDLAAWLNVNPFALHDFRPRDRDQSLTLHTQTFTIPPSAALFKAMAKPAHTAIKSGPDDKSAIVFVPSRGQCQSVARDLITQCALEYEVERGYLPAGISTEMMEQYAARLLDPTLTDLVMRGIGIFHEGIWKRDRTLMLELYAEGIIRVLMVPRDSCWTVPVRASVIIVMGTQYIHVEGDGAGRQIRDYDLQELVRMQSRAVRHGSSGHFHLFCQAESKDTFVRFLEEGLPLESKLLETDVLKKWYQERRKNGSIATKQEAVDALGWTFLSRRMTSNPTYYDTSSTSRDENLSRLVDRLDKSVDES